MSIERRYHSECSNNQLVKWLNEFIELNDDWISVEIIPKDKDCNYTVAIIESED